MIVLHQNGNRSTPDAGRAIKGSRIKSVTLDRIDVNNILELTTRGINDYMLSLSNAMVKTSTVKLPDAGLVYSDVDEEDYGKPPLGIIPNDIWVDKRRDDINKAISRYKEANIDVPAAWTAELLSMSKIM